MSHWQKPPLGVQLIPGHPMADGLVGCWLLNEGSGDRAFDLSGNGNNSTIYGADWQDSGLQFDYTQQDYCTIPDNPSIDYSLMSGVTVSVLARPNVLTAVPADDMAVFGQAGDHALDQFPFYVFLDYPDDVWRVTIHQDTVFPTVLGLNAVTVGTLYHVIATWRANEIKLYVDGKLQGINTDSSPALENSPESHHVGCRYITARDEYFSGRIHNIQMFNKCFTPSQVATLCANPYAMFEPEPIWLMAQSVKAVPNIMQNMNQFNGGMAC